MKARGYDPVSENISNKGFGGVQAIDVNFIKHITGEITLHAKVKLNPETVCLSFVELKYFCQLSANGFDLHHKDFEKYEQIISMYAAKCLDIDVFGVLNSMKPKPPEEDFTIRKRKLWDKIVAEGKVKKYDKETCLEFYGYWTEKNEKGKLMRFEMEKIFDIPRRLQTWLSKDKKWAKNFIDKKEEKQNKEMEVKKQIKKDERF